MNHRTKLALATLAMTLLSTPLHAQSLRAEVYKILNEWALPIASFIFVLSTFLGVYQNYDKIIDKDGNGTRKEGFINLAMIMGFVILGMALIGAVARQVGNMSLS